MIWTSNCRASVCLSESMFLGLIVLIKKLKLLCVGKWKVIPVPPMTWLTSLDIVAWKILCCSLTLLHIADSCQHTWKGFCLSPTRDNFHYNEPNEDPWGQPRDILDHSLVIVPSFTWLYLLFRNDRIRSTDWLVKPYALSFLMTKLWHRESKALLMSVDRMVTNSFLSIACFQSSVSLTSVVSKVQFFLYAVNLGDRVGSK